MHVVPTAIVYSYWKPRITAGDTLSGKFVVPKRNLAVCCGRQALSICIVTARLRLPFLVLVK